MKNNKSLKTTSSQNVPVADKREITTPKRWGDSEHDTIIHSTLKPHSDIPNYNPEWGCYRHEE